MGLIAFIVAVVVAVAAYAAYQLYKSKTAITVANVVAQAKTDASAAASDVKKS
jgi:uncharacterized membrane protein